MIRRLSAFLCCLALVGATGCSGFRMTETDATAHAESFRIVGFPIPEDDQVAARRVWDANCAGFTVDTEASSPADWTSFVGFFGNLFGFHNTIIAGHK